MTMNRRTVLGSALAALAPAILPLPARAAGVSDKEIVLGTHLDLSGPVAVAMPPIKNGMQMRIDEANDAGGIHGRKIRLVIEDNASQPPQAVRAVDKLIRKDEIFAMLCPFGSGANVATTKKVLDAGVLVFAPYAASALVRQAGGGDNPLLFTTNLHYDTTTAAGVRWALANLSPTKVGFIYQEGPFGELVGKGLKAALAAKGMPLVAEASYKVGDIDFSSQVARLKGAGVDLIVDATTTRETIAVCAETKKIGWNVKILTASPGRAGLTATLGKASVEGLYGIGGWRIVATDQLAGAGKAWADGYRKRFQTEPDDVAMIFYDYTDWFLKSVEAAGKDLTTDRLVKALQASSFKGLASYDTQRFKNNHIDPEWMQVEQIQQGRWVARSGLIDPARAAA